MSCKSSLSMKPSRFWSIMLKASLNSWIWDWSNMAKTLDVALWGRFLVVLALARLLDILASGAGASLQEGVWDDDGYEIFLPPPDGF